MPVNAEICNILLREGARGAGNREERRVRWRGRGPWARGAGARRRSRPRLAARAAVAAAPGSRARGAEARRNLLSSWPRHPGRSSRWASRTRTLPHERLGPFGILPGSSKGKLQDQMLPRVPGLGCFICRIPPCARNTTEQTVRSTRWLGTPSPPHSPALPREELRKLGSISLFLLRHRSRSSLRFRNN